MFTSQEDPLRLAYMVASIMNLETVREQALLEAPTRVEALRLVHGWLSHEVEVLELRNKITEEARGEMSREQREYILRQQKRAIEQELGEKNRDQAEVETLREKLAKADLPEDVRKEADRELGRLEKHASGAAGAQHDPHVARIRDRAAVEQAQRGQSGSARGRGRCWTRITSASPR